MLSIVSNSEHGPFLFGIEYSGFKANSPPLRVLTLCIGLSILGCGTPSPEESKSADPTSASIGPNHLVALQFINDYVTFCEDIHSETTVVEWVNNRQDVSQSFKTELARIMDDAEIEDPEYGLGFDPILNAQDHVGKFEIHKVESEYLVVQGADRTNTELTLKISRGNDRWLVEGAGIVNIPENRRPKN